MKRLLKASLFAPVFCLQKAEKSRVGEETFKREEAFPHMEKLKMMSQLPIFA